MEIASGFNTPYNPAGLGLGGSAGARGEPANALSTAAAGEQGAISSGVAPGEQHNRRTPASSNADNAQFSQGKDGDAASSSAEARSRVQKALERRQEQQEIREIRDLSARDREVRAHEQAHMAVGGQYAGAASYQFQRGPDGINYAVSGEVPISTGKEATPEATLRKAQIVRRAALAPAEPSAQDRRVAALAARMEAEALQEIAQLQQGEATPQADTSNAAGQTARQPTGAGNLGADSNSASNRNDDTPGRAAAPAAAMADGDKAEQRLQSRYLDAYLAPDGPGRLLSQFA